MYYQFKNFAEYLSQAYGCAIVENEETGLIESVECPECAEPILFDDWAEDDTECWTMCPICYWREYEDEEYDDFEEDDE